MLTVKDCLMLAQAAAPGALVLETKQIVFSPQELHVTMRAAEEAAARKCAQIAEENDNFYTRNLIRNQFKLDQ
jgi:hypothetical protein